MPTTGRLRDHSERNYPLGTQSEEVQAKAELRFKKLKQASAIRAKSMSDYEAVSQRRAILTAKLKALRLAKEAADVTEAAKLPPRKRSAGKTPKQ